jgi:hypothetical protein
MDPRRGDHAVLESRTWLNRTESSSVTHREGLGRRRCVSRVSTETQEMTMHLFRARERRTDPLWDVAQATQVLVADPTTVTSLALGADVRPSDAAVDGVGVATRHPTGWFIHAVRRDDLPGDQLEPFRELVTVRSYLLLARGPEAPAWRRSPTDGEWRSVWLSPARELAELDAALVE